MIVLGAMSGTSTDGVDVAALRLSPEGEIHYLGMHSESFAAGLRDQLLRLQHLPPQFLPHEDPLVYMLLARKALTEVYVHAAQGLMHALGLRASDIAALGAHGQTLRHRPELGFTYQMLDAALLATSLACPVVHDFRSKDVALGGQGAPLVPAFHQAWLKSQQQPSHCAVLNLGGFSNLTVLGGSVDGVRGGDCGPANCLMDFWAQTRFGRPMDAGGEIAKAGRVHPALLKVLCAHPFLEKSWPKSTGRDEFSVTWFESCLTQAGAYQTRNEDVMATLLAFSVHAIAVCLPSDTHTVFLCGGGAFNPTFVEGLMRSLSHIKFEFMDQIGLPVQAVEACAFAWMAAQTMQELPSNCIGVTGAHRLGILGSVQHFG